MIGFLYSEFGQIEEYSGEYFDVVAASGERRLSVASPAGVEMTTVLFATPRFFDVIGVYPVVGRGFVGGDHRSAARPVVIVSHAFWKTRLAGDETVVGRTVTVGARDAVIVGVLPEDFRGLSLAMPVDLYMPMRSVPLVAGPGNFFSDSAVAIGDLRYPPESWVRIAARLSPDRRAADAEAMLTATINRTKPPDDRDDAVVAVSVARAAVPAWVRATTQNFVAMLAVISGMIFCAACASVAGMMLVRNEQRRREMNVRAWVGATRTGIFRLVLVEALLLAGVGAMIGLQVSAVLMRLADRVLVLPGVAMTQVNGGWTAYTALVAAMATMLIAAVGCGTIPALHAGNRRYSRGWRGGMLVGQVVVVVGLSIGAMLFARSMRAMTTVDVGFDGDGLFYVITALRTGRANESSATFGAYRRLLERVQNTAGVESVTVGNLPLVDGAARGPVSADGDVWRSPMATFFLCGPGYGRTVEWRLAVGRDFDEARDVEGSEPVAIVSESVARYLWGGEEAVGRRFFIGPMRSVRVVGVLQEGRYTGLDERGGLAVFLPREQNLDWAIGAGTIIGRAVGEAEGVVGVVQREVQAHGRDVAIVEAATFESQMGVLMMPQRIGATLFGALGMLALLLAGFNVYGFVRHTVACGTREIGIRMALGASRVVVVRRAVSGTLGCVAVGLVVGIGVAAVGTAWTEEYLFGVGRYDWVAYATVVAIVGVATCVGALVPAVRATRTASVGEMIRRGSVYGDS